MIDFQNVSVAYSNGVQALCDIDLHFEKGEFVFLVGPTGTGKSTLLKLVYRGVLPIRGSVTVAGEDVTTLHPSRVPYLRRRLGVVFQDFQLLPQKTVYENVAYALHAIGVPYREIRRRVRTAGPGRPGPQGGCLPSQLSGGAAAVLHRPCDCQQPTHLAGR